MMIYNLFLVIVASIITVMFFLPLLVFQIIKKANTRSQYLFNVAVHLDYLWASLIFGIQADGHTVSALVYKKMIDGDTRYKKYVRWIDWLFQDNKHSYSSYIKEFKGKV